MGMVEATDIKQMTMRHLGELAEPRNEEGKDKRHADLGSEDTIGCE